jgi:hypothetical protein
MNFNMMTMQYFLPIVTLILTLTLLKNLIRLVVTLSRVNSALGRFFAIL